MTKPPQLNDFLGKSYVLSHNEYYEEFLKELGVRKNTRKHALNSKPTVVLSQLKCGDYLLDTTYPEGRRVKFRFKIGEAVPRHGSTSCPHASVFSVIDNKLIEEQCYNGQMVTIEREFTKDYLKVTMKVNDIECNRYYVHKSSDISFRTETSRRISIWCGVEESEESLLPTSEDAILEDVSEESIC